MASMLSQQINKDGKLICHECAQMNLFIYLFITIYGLRKTRPKDELQKSQLFMSYLWENIHQVYDLYITCIQYLGHAKLSMFHKITLGQCPGYVKSHISYKSA